MNADSTPAIDTPEHGSGLGDAMPSYEPWPALVIGNAGYTEEDGDAYWFSGIARNLKHELFAIGREGTDFEYAVRTLARFSTHPDPEVRVEVLQGARLLAQRCGIVEELREIGRRAVRDEAPNVRYQGCYFEEEAKRFHTPEELAMQKRLPSLEFQLWLIRDDPVATENHWRYRRIWAEERKAAYAQMTKAQRKRYRQQFIRNSSLSRKMIRQSNIPDKEAFKQGVQQRIIDNSDNRQRRAWVPRWLP